MKKTSVLMLILVIASATHFSFAQRRDTIYYDLNWKDCTKQSAKYYRLFTRQPTIYILTDKYISTGKPQMIAECSLTDSLQKNGKCTYYNENGTKESEGQYVNNARTGNWIWWDKNEKDSSVDVFEKDIHVKWIYQSKENKDQKFTFVQQMPEFPGGDKALFAYLSSNIHYPENARKKEIEGTVLLQFIVNEDGSISDVMVLRDVGAGCSEEAVRVVSSMPNWKPGVQNGDKVKVYYHLPVTFQLLPAKKTKKKKNGNPYSDDGIKVISR